MECTRCEEFSDILITVERHVGTTPHGSIDVTDERLCPWCFRELLDTLPERPA